MILIGGTYREIDEYSDTSSVYGSGIRALETILEFNDQIHIDFYTCCDCTAGLRGLDGAAMYYE